MSHTPCPPPLVQNRVKKWHLRVVQCMLCKTLYGCIRCTVQPHDMCSCYNGPHWGCYGGHPSFGPSRPFLVDEKTTSWCTATVTFQVWCTHVRLLCLCLPFAVLVPEELLDQRSRLMLSCNSIASARLRKPIGK